ncbi:protocadherin alpha-4-like isoform X20 [Lepisosteus oculatus]|uniref:protocadherin alpha-4-like isoform X20 n=1 Tax=Lepisosteus oculatus TaxID=7918 RepID=UPI0035F51146
MVQKDIRKRWEYRRRLLHFACLLCFWKRSSAQIRYSIQEELNIGAFVGNIAQDLGFNIEKLRDRGFRVVSASKEQLFQVNQKDGSLLVNANIDREELCNVNPKCVINLKAVIENPLEMHHVEIEIVDINDHSPSFPIAIKRLEISESTLPGTRFQLEGARDQDVGINSLRIYKLNQNEYFKLEIKDRSVDNKIPVLVLQIPLDREKKPEHHLILTAFDGGTPERSGILNITVAVLDINDNTPVFDQEIYSVTLPENVPIGTFVIQVNATDLDDGANGDVLYSFGNTMRSEVYDTFILDVSTGEIKVKGLIDFEKYQSFEIDVQASDRGQFPFTVHCSVFVKVEDVNDNRPEIDITSLSHSVVPENAHPGTVVALMGVTDLDSGLNGQVVCTLPNKIPFELKPSSTVNFYSLAIKRNLDRETIPVHNVTITAKDRGNPPLSSFKTITVIVSDVNDNAPKFSQNPYMLYLPENNVPGSLIFSVSAEDADQNENALISYTLENNMFDTRTNSYLNINSENGNIYALKSFDFEELKNFKFRVIAKDAGVPSLSSNVTVNVFILDQNDNGPVILSPVSANGSAEAVEEVPRNVNAGYLVTKVRAYDADIGYNAWLSFSLLHVSDSRLFSLERYTGEIRTLRPFTDTDETEHKLIIQVKDNGNFSLSTTATILVLTVENTKSYAVSDFKHEQHEENNTTFYLLASLGSVSVLFAISIFALIATQCCKQGDSSKDSRDKMYADVSGNGTLCHSIQYRAGNKHYMVVGPRLSVGSTMGLGSNRNTLILPENTGKNTGESKPPNADWRYSASLRAGMQSSVHMEESAILQGAPGVLVQNWPTVSSATGGEPEGGEVSPPVGAGINSNSWSFRYGPGPGHPQALKPGEVPEAFIIPGSPAIISIRQDQPTGDDKSDFITFGKKEETKKKKKKKKGKADKKEKGNNDNSEQ